MICRAVGEHATTRPLSYSSSSLDHTHDPSRGRRAHDPCPIHLPPSTMRVRKASRALSLPPTAPVNPSAPTVTAFFPFPSCRASSGHGTLAPI